MSLYKLDHMLQPRSVAVIGASERRGGVGRALMDNLLAGGYTGEIFPINPRRDVVLGVPAFPSLSALDRPVDLVVVASPIDTVPGIIEEAGKIGCGGAVVISAGGKEAGEAGLEIEARIRDKAHQGRVRVIGPNCMGIIVSQAKLNASFSHNVPYSGKIAFISQSGGIGSAVLDYAMAERIGFSHLMSIGSTLDVDFGDLIDYLGNQPEVGAILLYIENVSHPRKFMSAARSVSRIKPIIALKVGRSTAGARAAMSHTGALAGEDDVYDAAFRRAGIIRVDSLEDLFACAELVGKQKSPVNQRLALITNAGGLGVMAADYLAGFGIEPAPLSDETRSKMDEILPRFWSRANPVDILGDAPVGLFRQAVEICLDSGDFDAVLVTTTDQAVNHPTDVAKAVIPVLKSRDIPVFTVWLGGHEVKAGRDLFIRNDIPTYDSIERAIRAFVYMVHYHQNLIDLRQIPPAPPHELDFDRNTADRVVRQALQRNGGLLSEVESKAILTAYGIPMTVTRAAATVDEAVRIAGGLDSPAVLKLMSPDITHKSDAGGVKLNLSGKQAVRRAFDEILDAARAYDPEAEITGVTVQPMVRSGHFELILGLKQDPDFGPVVLFGMGGVTAELFKDRAVGLPPLNRLLVHRLMERTKVFRLLQGYRNIPPADIIRLEEILIRLGQLAIDFPEIVELDINPMIVSGPNVVGVDARIVIRPARVASPAHLAISPYPNQYEFRETTRFGLELFIRPIKPEDAPLMIELWNDLSPRSVYHRFLKPLRHLSEDLLARHTQIDYDRHLALVALTEIDGRERIVGVARLIQHPDGHEAELGLSVGDPWHGRGVAAKLLETALPIARERGIGRIWTHVFPENRAALTLAEEFCGHVIPIEDDGIYEISVEP